MMIDEGKVFILMMFSIFEFIFPIIFIVLFTCVTVAIVISFARGIKEWNRNNHSPVLEVEAKIVSKREDVYHHHHHSGNNHAMHTTHTTYYYATFEVASGDRMEFSMSGQEYGMLAEGDCGRLTFQGSRYLSFTRC